MLLRGGTLFFVFSSISCYDKTLKLEPEFDAARKRKHAVLCHQKVENGLEAQHE